MRLTILLEAHRFARSNSGRISRIRRGVYVECACECLQGGSEYINSWRVWKRRRNLAECELYRGCSRAPGLMLEEGISIVVVTLTTPKRHPRITTFSHIFQLLLGAYTNAGLCADQL
jgi:hypothetical protein